MKRDERISWRAELARLGLRLLVKRAARHKTVAQARHRFRAMEVLIPRPPRSTQTRTIEAGDVRADLVMTPDSRADRYVLYLHGGAYRVGSPSTYRHFTWRVARTARARVLVPTYRLAPEHPFPAALDDAVTAYLWLLTEGADPRRMTVIGDSAGGGLALALLLKLRDDGIVLPAAAVALSPWTDLALTGASLATNAEADPMINADDIPAFAADYLRAADPRNPYASPLYGNLRGLPAIMIQVGSDEVLRDDAVRMAQRLGAANIPTVLQVWPRMPHVWQLLAPFLPEARSALEEIGRFVDWAIAGRPGGRAPVWTSR
ncbi:MAG TPA: alpha/beta hydrolase [Pseudolabrys sp.]|nr:alpha/beta hydrolase [Pseudolabrys sp.]